MPVLLVVAEPVYLSVRVFVEELEWDRLGRRRRREGKFR